MSSEGILCVGDSIINADKSWGYWLSEITGQPLHRISVGGAKSSDVLGQLPQIADEKFAVACLTVGTNDVLLDWQPEAFRANLGQIIDTLHGAADKVLVQTVPTRLAYFPGVGPVIRKRVEVANRIIRDLASDVVEGADLYGPTPMSPDMIHPNVIGQLELADRAAAVLGIEARPSRVTAEEREFVRRDYVRFVARQLPKRLVKRVLGRAF